MPPEGTRAFRAAAAVDELASLTVEDWAGALRCSSSTLYRLCKRDLGASPNDLLLRYVAASAAAMDAAGVTRSDAAVALDYADGVALCHALRTARRKGLTNAGNDQCT